MSGNGSYNLAPAYDGKIGLTLIFNHIKFKNPLIKSRKFGGAKDVKNVKNTFEKLGFIVKVYNDLTKTKVEQMLQKRSQNMDPKVSCLVVVVMTHGQYGGQLRAYDENYSVNTVLEPFTSKHCPALQGKPKLIFIQACQYGNINVKQSLGVEVAPEEDFYICFSTFPGDFSARSEEGGWFTQELCKHLNNFGTQWFLQDIIKETNRKMCQLISKVTLPPGNPANVITLQQCCFYLDSLTLCLKFPALKTQSRSLKSDLTCSCLPLKDPQSSD